MSVQMREEISLEERVCIAIETSSADRRIKRIASGQTWRDATLAEALKTGIETHDRLRQIDQRLYELEHSSVNELQTLLHAGTYHVRVNGSVVSPEALSSHRLGELVGRIEDPRFRYGVVIKVEKSIVENKVEEQPQVEPVQVDPDEPPLYVADESKKLTKYELLKEELAEPVESLPLCGLFVGNLLQNDKIDPRIFEYLPVKRVNDLLGTANRYLREKKYRMALEIYELFATVEPENADYKFLCGKSVTCMGQYHDGMKLLKEAQELGHEKAGAIIQAVNDYRQNYGAFPPTDEAPFFF